MRRVWALLQGLPPEAATWRGKDASWTARDELLQAVLDRVDYWGRVNAAVHGAKKTSLAKPPQSLRPGDIGKRGANVLSVSEFAAHYQQRKEGESK